MTIATENFKSITQGFLGAVERKPEAIKNKDSTKAPEGSPDIRRKDKSFHDFVAKETPGKAKKTQESSSKTITQKENPVKEPKVLVEEPKVLVKEEPQITVDLSLVAPEMIAEETGEKEQLLSVLEHEVVEDENVGDLVTPVLLPLPQPLKTLEDFSPIRLNLENEISELTSQIESIKNQNDHYEYGRADQLMPSETLITSSERPLQAENIELKTTEFMDNQLDESSKGAENARTPMVPTHAIISQESTELSPNQLQSQQMPIVTSEDIISETVVTPLISQTNAQMNSLRKAAEKASKDNQSQLAAEHIAELQQQEERNLDLALLYKQQSTDQEGEDFLPKSEVFLKNNEKDINQAFKLNDEMPLGESLTQQADQAFADRELQNHSTSMFISNPQNKASESSVVSEDIMPATPTPAGNALLTPNTALKAELLNSIHSSLQPQGMNQEAVIYRTLNVVAPQEGKPGKMMLQLVPETLGQVEVNVNIALDGRIDAVVVVERSHTYDLFRHDHQELQRVIADAFNVDVSHMNFNLSHQEHHPQQDNLYALQEDFLTADALNQNDHEASLQGHRSSSDANRALDRLI